MSDQKGVPQPTAQQELARLVRQASGHGRFLDGGVRRSLEHSIGTDLSGLRLHTGDLAYRLTTLLGSAAATAGRDIFIPQASYSPSTRDGLHLLAHEAAHAVQQAQGVGRERNMGIVGAPGSYWALEAEAVAMRVLAGVAAPTNRLTPQQPNSPLTPSSRASTLGNTLCLVMPTARALLPSPVGGRVGSRSFSNGTTWLPSGRTTPTA